MKDATKDDALDYIKNNKDLQKKIDSYVERVVAEDTRFMRPTFMFRSAKKPLATRIKIGVLIGVTSLVLGYVFSYRELKRKTEITGLSTSFLWNYRWNNDYRPRITSFFSGEEKENIPVIETTVSNDDATILADRKVKSKAKGTSFSL